MVVNEYRVFVAETRTGKVLADLPAAKFSYGLRLNGAGPLSADLRPAAAELAGLDLRGLTRGVSRSLGIAYGDRILECGPIWKRPYRDGTLSLTAAGLWSLFDKRKALPGSALVDGAEPTKAKITASGSLGDIARQLVRISIQDNPYGASVGALPVVLPPVEGGPHVRNYYGYDLGWIGKRLQELTEVEDGPDIRFRPRYKNGDPQWVEWVLETGTGAQPLLQQTGQDWIWDNGAAGSPVVDLETEEDFSTMATRAWAPGSGQERSMRLRYATNTALVTEGMPWLETDQAAKETEDLAVLQAQANRLRAEAARPWNVVSVDVRADTSPVLGEYQPGDWARIIVRPGHPTLDPGEQRVRLLAVDGNGSGVVSLAVSPFQDTTPNGNGVGNIVRDSDDETALAGTWAAGAPGTWTDLPSGTWSEQ